MARPRIHLNCAASLDGRLAAPDGSRLRLSDTDDMRRVHMLRTQLDGILVGVGTVLEDDPSLRVDPELAAGPDPTRIVLDTSGRTPEGAKVLDGAAPTIVLHGPDVAREWGAATGIGVPVVQDGGDTLLDLAAALEAVHGAGIEGVLVEGGGRVLRSFLESGCWDTFTLYQAPCLIGGTGPQVWPGTPSPAGWPLQVADVTRAGEGALWTFSPA